MWESVANTSVTQQNTWQIWSRSTINLYSSIKSLRQSSESERTSGKVDMISSTWSSFLRADKAGFWICLESGLLHFVLWCSGCFCRSQVLLDLLVWVPNLTTWAPQSKRLREEPKDSSPHLLTSWQKTTNSINIPRGRQCCLFDIRRKPHNHFFGLRTLCPK